MLMMLLLACEIGLVPANPAYLNQKEDDSHSVVGTLDGDGTDSDWEVDVSGLSDEDDAPVEEDGSWGDENTDPSEDESEDGLEDEDDLPTEDESTTESDEAFEDETEDETEDEPEEISFFDPTADIDGDGFSPDEGDCNDSDRTIYPGNPDLAGDGIDNDCDGFDSIHSGIQCAYNVEMVCGSDGWVGRMLLVQTGSQSYFEWTNACQNHTQGWSHSTSEAFDIQLSPGGVLHLELCADSDCVNTVPPTNLGLVVKVNGTLIDHQSTLDDSWGLAHQCPY
ncbi:MAG: MopE-related protein [Myxococcota bacterium]|nr:MopE-related protein [Myxococcota bacterium]